MVGGRKRVDEAPALTVIRIRVRASALQTGETTPSNTRPIEPAVAMSRMNATARAAWFSANGKRFR